MQTELITIKEYAQRMVQEHRTRAKLEARLAELRKHQQELVDQHRIVATVIGELETILKGEGT